MVDFIDRVRAALADRYTVKRELGRGGMATVFLAEDQKLHRRVALKVLRAERDWTQAELAAAVGVDVEPKVDYAAAKDHVAEVIDTIAPVDSQERFEGLGVQVIREFGRFVSETEVQAGETVIAARRVVVATGSRPFVPDIPGLELHGAPRTATERRVSIDNGTMTQRKRQTIQLEFLAIREGAVTIPPLEVVVGRDGSVLSERELAAPPGTVCEPRTPQ